MSLILVPELSEAHRQALAPFSKALEGLASCSVQEVADIAGRVASDIEEGEIKLGLVTGASSATSFTPYNVSLLLDRPVFYPMIRFDVTRSYTTSEIQADLLRTLAVVSQYPVNGYERRLHTVYRDALGKQAVWLKMLGLSLEATYLDPRQYTAAIIIRELLSDEEYLTDAGFEDFRVGCLLLSLFGEQNLLEPARVQRVLARKDDKLHFVKLRESSRSILYSRAISELGDEQYMALGVDERAIRAAQAIVMVIYLGGDEMERDD